MLKKTINKSREKDLVALEIAEMHEIAERLISKLESRVKVLESAEKRVDEKIERLERLIEKAELLQTSSGDPAGVRSREIQALVQKGLAVDEIAQVLNMPKGEIELILSLNR
ncbi:MAG: DUF2802 domain-containing protein [Thermodesulfovibrionales bacterium]